MKQLKNKEMKTLKLGLIILFTVIYCINSFGQIGYSSASFSQARANGIVASNQIIVEEYLNYHKHNIPLPSQNEAVAMDVRWGNKYINSNTNEAVLQIGFATNAFDDYSEIPPVNISLVIDKSGSMASDNRIGKLKIALNEFVDRLRPDDILSIVVYDSEAETLLQAQKVGNGKLIKLAISGLTPGGSTNLNAGMVMGYEEVVKNLDKNRPNKVILLTDGQTNCGVTKTEDILKNSEKYNKQGIVISTIGVGYGVNYDLLRQISKNGNGANHFVGVGEDVQKVFIDEVESLLSPVAKDVLLTVEFENDLEINHIYGYEPKIGSNKVQFKLDDMNSCLTQIVLLKFNAKKNLKESEVKVTFDYLDIKTNKRESITKNATLIFNSNETKSFVVDKEVKRNYTIAIMAQALKDMAFKFEAGKDTEACQVIDDCLKEVHTYYPSPKDKDLVRVLEIVERYKSPNQTGGKSIDF